MPGYLRIDDTWVPVTGVSVPHNVAYDRPVVIETTLGGVRKAQVAPRAHRDWSVRLGLADAETLRLWERLIDGVYGPGPFDWIDPLKAAAAAGTAPAWHVIPGAYQWRPLGHGLLHFVALAGPGAGDNWTWDDPDEALTPSGGNGQTWETTAPAAGTYGVVLYGDGTYSHTITVTDAMMDPPLPVPATPRPVVLTSLGRADRRATTAQQLTAISITLAEVGP